MRGFDPEFDSMPGITHAELVNGFIRSERTVFDAVAVLKQIASQRG